MNETQKAVSAAANPQAALLQIAISLDRLHDRLDNPAEVVSAWGDWSSQDEHIEAHQDFKARFDEALEAGSNDRWAFAKDTLQLDLGECDEYAAEGPVWFHGMHAGLVKQYGRAVHVQMIQDAETYDPQGAAEMGRDLLKVQESGMAGGAMLAQGNVG